MAHEHVTPKCLDPGMNQVADVGNAVAADAADFLVRKAVLELETDDLALIEWQHFQQLEDPRTQLMPLGQVERPGGRVQAAKHLFVA